MTRLIMAALAFFSVSGFTHHDPIIEFPVGTYLGEGKFVRTTGEEGVYSSYASFYNDEWYLALVFDGRLSVYELYFTFGFEGFFHVEATEHTPDGNEYTHSGYGHCASFSCHYTFELYNRTIEETISFVHNKVYRLGSMRYFDDNGDIQTIAWEEQMLQIMDNGDDDDTIAVPLPPFPPLLPPFPTFPGIPVPVPAPVPAPVPVPIS